jgi:hypothetical protein
VATREGDRPAPGAELRALLFGLAPYERGSAPEVELLADLAPALPSRHLARALFIVGAAAFVPLEVRAAVVTRALEPGVEPVPGEAAGVLARLPALVRLLLVERLDGGLVEAVLAAAGDDSGRRAELAAAMASAGAAGAQDVVLRELGRAVEGLGSAWWAPRACLDLLPHVRGTLPAAPGAVLLQNVRRLADPSVRAEILAAALPVLPDPERQDAEAAAMASARDERHGAKRAWALLRLADRVADPARSRLLAEAQAAAEALDEGESDRLRLLAALALRVPPTDAERILRAARRPFDEGRVLWPSADESLAAGYADLAGALPEERRHVLAEQVGGLQVAGESLLDERLLDLAPYLSEPQLEAAMAAAVQSRRRHAPWGAGRSPLRTLAPHLSPRLLAGALERIGRLPAGDAAEAARMLIDLAGVLPAGLAAAAARTASSLSSGWWSGRALATLGERLPEDARAQYAARADAVSPARLRSLLSRLPPDEQDEILEALLAQLWDRCAGAAPPPPAPDGEGGDRRAAAEPASAAPAPAPHAPDAASPAPAPRPMSGRGRLWDTLLRRTREAPGVRAASPPDNVVNTGFAAEGTPGEPLTAEAPLPGGAECLFWLEIGARVSGAIDTAPIGIPVDLLPEQPRLKVALFGFEGEMAIREGLDVGEIELLPDGRGRVLRPAARPDRLTDPGLLERRLFFPVSTPRRPGTFRLRCNIYCRQVLVQSHLVTAEVAPPSGWRRGLGRISRLLRRRPEARLRTTVDYVLSHRLRESTLQDLEPHRLSLMLNGNGDGSVGFRFFGGDGEDFKRDVSVAELELQDLIERARGAMRTSCWGNVTPWQGEGYRYADGPDLDRLKGDLVLFARWGYRFYDALVGRLAGPGAAGAAEGRRAVRRLHDLMRRPGLVQVASKLSARHVLPLAMMYDRPLDSTLRAADYTLCSAFERAFRQGDPLSQTPCFQGACPSDGQDTVVCPGGFWGFRHAIGMPVSVGGGGELAARIEYAGAPGVAVAVSTDPTFERRAGHEVRLRSVFPGSTWQYADNRDEAIRVMKEARAHVLYFYCHGGLEAVEERMTPFIQVGALDERGITRDLLRAKDIFWERPRPLVFINGCHTTALEPEQALDLVTAFVETSNAAGVIGTEVTIFEPLACGFAEECLARFAAGEPIGDAVRQARLKLLQEGNPLGLVYIPFVAAHLRLVGSPDRPPGGP